MKCAKNGDTTEHMQFTNDTEEVPHNSTKNYVFSCLLLKLFADMTKCSISYLTRFLHLFALSILYLFYQ